MIYYYQDFWGGGGSVLSLFASAIYISPNLLFINRLGIDQKMRSLLFYPKAVWIEVLICTNVFLHRLMKLRKGGITI